MSAPAIIIEIQCTAPGGEHLARHLRDRVDGAVVSEIADLSDNERRGLRVTTRIVGSDGVEE